MTEQKQLNLYQKIVAIMGELDYIQKGPKTVNGQYRYASHDQVTAAIHPFLVKYHVVVTPTVEELHQDNNRTTVKLAVVFRDADNPADAFVVNFFGFGVDSGDKGPGKAVSYAYKYALLKTFALETGDDPDQDAKAVYEPQKCLEFDQLLPADMTDKEIVRLQKFLEYCAESSNKHVEDVKRAAIEKMPAFIGAFRKWKPKG